MAGSGPRVPDWLATADINVSSLARWKAWVSTNSTLYSHVVQNDPHTPRAPTGSKEQPGTAFRLDMPVESAYSFGGRGGPVPDRSEKPHRWDSEESLLNPA